MLKVISFILILFCLHSCKEEKKHEIDNSDSSIQETKEMPTDEKQQDLILRLVYENTSVVDEDTLLNFTFSIRNNSLKVYNLIAHLCPNYDPFKLETDGLVYLFPRYNCFSNGIGYRIFKQHFTSKFNLQLKLERGIKYIENQKIRVGFDGFFGFQGQDPSESTETYNRLQFNLITYWSNYVVLKNEYKIPTISK